MRDVLFDGITCIREDLIEEAQTYVFQRRWLVWKYPAAIAAGFLLVVCFGWTVLAGIAASRDVICGDAGPSGMWSNSMPAEPSQEAPSGDSGGGVASPGDVHTKHSFRADVAEVGEGYILVIPLPGNPYWTVADRVTVPTDGAAELEEILPGDRVLIMFEGEAELNSVRGVTAIVVLPD